MSKLNGKRNLSLTCMHVRKCFLTFLLRHSRIMPIWSSIYADNGKTSKQCFRAIHERRACCPPRRGFWNEIWSNLSIEPTYMKTAKGPAGLIEQTNNSRAVTVWTNSHHLCSKKLTELESLMNRDKKLRKQA